ncbi:MAG: hypothetical protein H6765_06210 [Candidatus Peribacteria bacterium]|nr:MAG: hypothetical protein H6765_06210 [Candidatus Peribacteria bacterium]
MLGKYASKADDLQLDDFFKFLHEAHEAGKIQSPGRFVANALRNRSKIK